MAKYYKELFSGEHSIVLLTENEVDDILSFTEGELNKFINGLYYQQLRKYFSVFYELVNYANNKLKPYTDLYEAASKVDASVKLPQDHEVDYNNLKSYYNQYNFIYETICKRQSYLKNEYRHEHDWECIGTSGYDRCYTNYRCRICGKYKQE